jgi:L-fuconolactonase
MNSRTTRRDFLKRASAGLFAVSATADLPATLTQSASHYAGPIIDTHTHFYDPTRTQGVPWPPTDDKLLYRRVLPADYRALPKPQPVHGTVVVEASSWLEDNQWILDLAAHEPFIVGFVGHLDPGQDGFRSQLERFARNPLFRGIRIGADGLRERLRDGAFMENLALVAKHDLAVDLLGGAEMLPDTARLARAVPGLRLVIDHVANIPIDGKTIDPKWLDGMHAAGQQPHVYCKVSGLVEGSGRSDGGAPHDVSFYQPFLNVIWDAFGSDRLVYGSNWPVSERFAPCAVVQQIVADYFTPKGPEALGKVFSKNSKACYKWIERGNSHF